MSDDYSESESEISLPDKQDLRSDDDSEVLDYLSDTPYMYDESFMKTLKRDTKFPGAVMIIGLPKVNKSDTKKVDRLNEILRRIVDRVSDRNRKEMPFNEKTGQSEGYVMVEFDRPQDADAAVKVIDNMDLDANFRFRCVKIDDFDDIMMAEPQMKAAQKPLRFTRMNFRNWIHDPADREQLLIRYQDETEIHWHDPMNNGLELVYGGEREKKSGLMWCDWRVQWSPKGNYLVTFHKKGIALWAEDDLRKITRFAHEGVRHADFSPDEKYVLTWNGTGASQDDPSAVRVFNILTGQELKCLPTPVSTPSPNDEFPHFLWSHTGRYIAKCSLNDITVYQVPSMEVLRDPQAQDKRRPLPFEGLHSFAWSPKDDIISVWVKEKDNAPARLTLVEIPTRTELASRSRTQVDAKMIWQSEGDYLCLSLTKLTKYGKKKGASVEIFRIRDKDIPVDTVDLKDMVKGFFWETRSNRFALITEQEQDKGAVNPRLSFYSLRNSKCEMVASMELPSAAYSDVFWAPEGQYFVVAAIPGGDLLWGMLTEPDNRLEILYKDEHFMLTDVEWDPSSRYVLTSVVQPMIQGRQEYRYQMEAGFNIWTFQGRLLYRQQKEKLWNVAWRPRPNLMLTEQRAKEIRSGLKKFSKKYDALDEQSKERLRTAQKRYREEKIGAFEAVVGKARTIFAKKASRNGWEEAYKLLEEDSPWHETQVYEDEIMSVQEDPIPST